MKTPKVKMIDSKVNPYNPITQKEQYEQFENYMEFIRPVESSYSDNWDDDIAQAIINPGDDVKYFTDVICDRMSKRFEKGASVSELSEINPVFYRAVMETTKAENRKDEKLLCKVIVRGCLKSLERNSADAYIMDVIEGKRPHDIEDMESVAFSEYCKSMAYHSSQPFNGKWIDLNETQPRKVRKQTVTAWDHIPTDADYTEKERTMFEWMRSAVYAYIQTMRGVRIPVTERVKLADVYIPTKRGKNTIWKHDVIEKVKNNSVYFPIYSADDMTDEMYYRMKATGCNTKANDAPHNEYIARLAKTLRTKKIVSDKQLKVLQMHTNGDSFYVIADAMGCDESTVRGHYNDGMKKVLKWLESMGYKTETALVEIQTKNGKTVKRKKYHAWLETETEKAGNA